MLERTSTMVCKTSTFVKPTLVEIRVQSNYHTINSTCDVLNKIVIQHIFEKIPYERLKAWKPNIFYFCVFSCKCFILNNLKDKLSKFDVKYDDENILKYT